jgi:hypothetical protein
MMTRFILIAMVMVSLIAGAALWYLQVYAYYSEVRAEDVGNVQLTSLFTAEPEEILFENFKGIDSESSPIRFRACFETSLSQALLTETYVTYPRAVVPGAPGWFTCFDPAEIDAALQTGTAIAFLGVENIRFGIDRVVAVMPDGRGYAWHQINACGATVFNGEPAPEGCPPVPESLQ